MSRSLRLLLLFSASLFSACATQGITFSSPNVGAAGHWTLLSGDASVENEKGKTVVHFQDRVFTIENLALVGGTVTGDKVLLRAPDGKITITGDAFEATNGGKTTYVDLAKLPADRPVRYDAKSNTLTTTPATEPKKAG